MQTPATPQLVIPANRHQCIKLCWQGYLKKSVLAPAFGSTPYNDLLLLHRKSLNSLLWIIEVPFCKRKTTEEYARNESLLFLFPCFSHAPSPHRSHTGCAVKKKRGISLLTHRSVLGQPNCPQNGDAGEKNFLSRWNFFFPYTLNNVYSLNLSTLYNILE